MSMDQLARQDYERALSRGFWRRIISFLTGEDNELLPFYEVRERLPIRGQHYIGLRQVEIEKIVGSLGRYYDFDRAFLPLQRRTRERWVSIDMAHYAQAPLPPVDLYKIGDIYFVKDGNHRVSVARERGQEYVDAYVTEIEISVRLTPETRLDDLALKKAYADFLEQTQLSKLRAGAEIELSQEGFYAEMLRHIAAHRWYLGEQRGQEVPYEDAVASWYDQVYLPLAETVRENELVKAFPGSSQADLCLWLMEYRDYLSQAYQEEEDGIDGSAQAARQLMMDYPLPAVKKLAAVVQGTGWLGTILLAQEKANFLEQTRLVEVCPQACIEVTVPGQYRRLREHIDAHRWYLGEQRGQEVSYEDALVSWYQNVYSPLVETIRQQEILKEFPGRTETDLYLWITTHRWYLRQAYGDEVPLEQAAEQFADDYSERPMKKVVKAIKKATRKE
ncbi:MAG: DUF4032 domain-containing protein [Chloroflexota bacterium]